MKDSKPRILVKEDAEQQLGHVKADTGVPIKRLRGLAIEFAIDQQSEFIDYIQDSNDE